MKFLLNLEDSLGEVITTHASITGTSRTSLVVQILQTWYNNNLSAIESARKTHMERLATTPSLTITPKKHVKKQENEAFSSNKVSTEQQQGGAQVQPVEMINENEDEDTFSDD